MTQILTFWVAKFTASLPLLEGSIVPYLAALHEFIGELPVELIEQVRAVLCSLGVLTLSYLFLPTATTKRTGAAASVECR
jgi:hypothetical protein